MPIIKRVILKEREMRVFCHAPARETMHVWNDEGKPYLLDKYLLDCIVPPVMDYLSALQHDPEAREKCTKIRVTIEEVE